MKRGMVAALLAAIPAGVAGRSPAPPSFEAATIRLAARDSAGSGVNLSPARIRIVNSPLKFCVRVAWDVQDFQVSGASSWMDTNRYESDAVAAGPFNGSEFRVML